MNKKIFTLLAGAFLLLATVFPATAQTLSSGTQKLRLGDPIESLGLGASKSYYHLRVDSIQTATPGTKAVAANDSIVVLFLGKPDADGKAKLFVDTLSNPNPDRFEFSSAPNTLKSAASLWCTTVEPYDQGKNITFNFANKQWGNTPLEVDASGYQSWTDVNGVKTSPGEATVPGFVSGWQFSRTYGNAIEKSKPLISYITKDTVAVLASYYAVSPLQSDSVVVKIASALDVENGLVPGVLYFTLVEAKPFTLSAEDFNTVFATVPTAGKGLLQFDPSVSSPNKNPFADDSLTAHHFDIASVAAAGHYAFGGIYQNVRSGHPDTVHYPAAYLDTMGYMFFTNDDDEVLTVDTVYSSQNVYGDLFLQFGWHDSLQKSLNTTSYADSIMLGQKAFRLVYYPSGDSIYINAFHATYLPSYDSQLMQDSAAYRWSDSTTLKWFSYTADTSVLVIDGGATPIWEDTITARLHPGQQITDGSVPFPYSWWHRLYVTTQSLTADANRILTLNTSNSVNAGTVNTRIYVDVYDACSYTGSGKTSLGADLYLIKNTEGQYLYIPLYTAAGAPVWHTLEPGEDPNALPSYQWVIEPQYESESAPVTITNREFASRVYGNVQLITTADTLHIPAGAEWNNKKVDPNGFVPLDKAIKSNANLGYRKIGTEDLERNLYAFNYRGGINSSKYIGWDGDLKSYPLDSLVYVDYESSYERLYFRLTIVSEVKEETYGYTSDKVTDLVPLKRQAYRFTYEDPVKYACGLSGFCLANADYSYAVTKSIHPILGRPVFYLRTTYKEDGEEYYALVQSADTAELNQPNYKAVLLDYLRPKYGQDLVNYVQTINTEFLSGLFVAAVSDGTGSLIPALRVDAQTRVSTFKIVSNKEPLYRRFNTVKEGGVDGDDSPRTVKFYSQKSPNDYLFENTGLLPDQKPYWENGKKHYLGVTNISQNPKVNAAIFVDTAYVNRAGNTEIIKPQYLLAVRPDTVSATKGCDDLGEPTIDLPGYIRAYYLINASDSARITKTDPDYDYIWNTLWARLVFVDAIHANDALYIVKDPSILEGGSLDAKLQEPGKKQIDVTKLDAYAKTDQDKIKKIPLGDNTHKPVVFSFRLVERGSDDFIIESTSAEDNVHVKPCRGGWVKYQNGVPVISRSEDGAAEGIGEAEVFNVLPAVEAPVANEEVAATKVTVIGATGSVTILNAAGKSVVVNNILGQTIANTVLTSDNATIAAPKGIVVVAVEGEKAVKALVK
jgi:hypothetical protein